eukprot:229292_1
MRMIKVIWIIAIMIVSVISVKPTVPPSSSPTTPPTTHTPTTQTITPTQGPTLPTRSPVVPLYLPDTAFERYGLLCSLLPAIDPHLIFFMYRSYTPISENKFVSFNITSQSFMYHAATWGTWASSYSNNYYFTQKPTGVKLYLGGGLSFASYNLEQSPPKLTVESDSLFSGVDAGLCLLAITVEDNDYLIAFGGYGGTRRTLNRVFRVFDVSTQLEEPRRPSYQTARHSFTCHVVNNTFLYIIGGSVKYSSSGVHDTIEVLELPRPTDQMSSIDEVTGSWQYMKVRLLKPRAGHSSVVHAHGSSIVVFGGVITAEQYNWNVEIIDIVHQTVSYGGDSVYTGRYPCVVSVPPYIYKFGGEVGNDDGRTYEIYEPHVVYTITANPSVSMNQTRSPTLEPTLEPIVTFTQTPTDIEPSTANPIPTASVTYDPAFNRTFTQTPTDIEPSTANPIPTASVTYDPAFNRSLATNNYTISISLLFRDCEQDNGAHPCEINKTTVANAIDAIIVAYFDYNTHVLSTEIVNNKMIIILSIDMDEFNSLTGEQMSGRIENELEGKYGDIEVSVKETNDKDESNEAEPTKKNESWSVIVWLGIAAGTLTLLPIIICVRRNLRKSARAQSDQKMVRKEFTQDVTVVNNDDEVDIPQDSNQVRSNGGSMINNTSKITNALLVPNRDIVTKRADDMGEQNVEVVDAEDIGAVATRGNAINTEMVLKGSGKITQGQKPENQIEGKREANVEMRYNHEPNHIGEVAQTTTMGSNTLSTPSSDANACVIKQTPSGDGMDDV